MPSFIRGLLHKAQSHVDRDQLEKLYLQREMRQEIAEK